MIDPYTMERLNAERLRDIDREALGLSFSRLARRNRRRALKAATLRLANLLIRARERFRLSAGVHFRLIGPPIQDDPHDGP